jgi:hypothetical protein
MRFPVNWPVFGPARGPAQPAADTLDVHGFASSIAYALGFLFSPKPLAWVPPIYGRPFADLELHTHPRTSVARAARSGTEVILIGIGVDPRWPGRDEPAIAAMLARRLAAGEQPFLARLARIVGRFAILYRRQDGPWSLVNDAVGLRSVFYGGREQVIAGSHARLVALQYAPDVPTSVLRVRWGYPGDVTPFPGVRLLIPNHKLDLASGRMERFFPTGPVPARTPDAAAALCIRTGRRVLKALIRRGPVAVSLTAGLDSRVTLALSWPCRKWLRYFTYGERPRDTVDLALAGQIGRDLGLDHVMLDVTGDNPFAVLGRCRGAILRQLDLNSHHRHGAWLVPTYARVFGQWTYVHVRSNIYEIGRASFQYKRRKQKPPSSPETMVAYYRGWNPGNELDDAFVRESFEGYFERAECARALAYLDPHDLYFWEHRMPAWQANVLLESDCVWETMILLNSREVIAALVGVPVADRLRNRIFKKVLRRTLPRLMDYPVNPDQWPPP